MSIQARRLFARNLFALLVLAIFASCGSGGGGFPQIASPPPFDNAQGAQPRSQMHQLAFQLQLLDMALASDTGPGRNAQEEIITHLSNIERIGNDLRQGDMSSNHTFLRNDMANFLSTLTRARMTAERNPQLLHGGPRVRSVCELPSGQPLENRHKKGDGGIEI